MLTKPTPPNYLQIYFEELKKTDSHLKAYTAIIEAEAAFHEAMSAYWKAQVMK